MARGGAEALFKKNNKLESYLKRTLLDETFERVRAYESCIIVSEKENKAFKYVVLGDEWIYLTENPPKTLQGTVQLKDIVSVELVSNSGSKQKWLTYFKTGANITGVLLVVKLKLEQI